jgi:hypothetical protein
MCISCTFCLISRHQILVAVSKCRTKHYSFLMKSNQQSSLCCHMVRAGLYNFRCANFLFYVSLVLTTDKATVRFRSGMKCHTKHYSLLADKSVLFSHHINCFSGRIFTDMGQLLRLLSCKLLHMCEGTNVLPAHQHIFITCETPISLIPGS